MDKNVDKPATFLGAQVKLFWFVDWYTRGLWKTKIFDLKKKFSERKKVEKSAQLEREIRKIDVASTTFSENVPRFSEK